MKMMISKFVLPGVSHTSVLLLTSPINLKLSTIHTYRINSREIVRRVLKGLCFQSGMVECSVNPCFIC